MNLNLKQWGIIILTLATTGIHVSLLFPDLLFILNGAGFLVLLAAYILPINYFRQIPLSSALFSWHSLP